MTVSKTFLKILAAVVWHIGGLVLVIKAGSLLAEAISLSPERFWALPAVALGLGFGTVKAWLIFRRACRRNLARIDALTDPKIGQFFRPWFFFFLALMIAGGATLSHHAHGHYGFLIGVAILDLTIGTGLLGSADLFWRKDG